jgi:Rrf2 family protein
MDSMFSTTTEYALRSMVFLAVHHGSPQTAQQISAETKVPIDYLFKVLNLLARTGLVHAQRGKNGGYSLKADPLEISILDIVQAIEPIHRIKTCPLGIESHGVQLCSLHHKLDDAIRHIEDAFSSAKLADLIDDAAAVQPLCATNTVKISYAKSL